MAFDRRGHGRTADVEAPFHYEAMAEEAIEVLDQVVGGPGHLVGWSDGGIVALLVGLNRPDAVGRLVVIGTNFHHDGIMALDLDRSSELVAGMEAGYAERSPDGGDHFWRVLEKAEVLVAEEPTLTVEDLGRIAAPTLVVAGDDDLVRLDHTTTMYEALPAGQLAIVPRASHALPLEAPAAVTEAIADFLVADEPPLTFLPVRRADPARP